MEEYSAVVSGKHNLNSESMGKRIYNKLPDCEVEEKVKAASLNTDFESKIGVPSECSLEEILCPSEHHFH